MPVIGGIANFNSLAIRLPGTYTLTVSDPIDGIGATLSTSFTVTADHLVFVQQPTNVRFMAFHFPQYRRRVTMNLLPRPKT